jgi:NADH-quinone oxidoreductase subunit H
MWLIEAILLILSLYLLSGYFSIFERKVLAETQRRWGPNRAGVAGVGQPLADGLKLLLKEIVIPKHANSYLFILTALVGLAPTVAVWCYYGTGQVTIANNDVSILLILCLLSLSVYPILFAGWASKNRYALLGGIRGVSQFIAYEIGATIAILAVIMLTRSANILSISMYQAQFHWLLTPLLPIAILFVVVMLAETNRPPFDLPEAESELVSGFHVEYSSFLFATFVILENAAIVFSSFLYCVLFLGGDALFGFQSPLFLMVKMLIIITGIILVRAVTPRYRYDQVLRIGWKYLIPLSAVNLLVLVLACWN